MQPQRSNTLFAPISLSFLVVCTLAANVSAHTPTPPANPATLEAAPTALLGSRIFAPYLDTGFGPDSPVGDLAGNANNVSRIYTLAFILGQGCSASWNGTAPLNTEEADDWGTRISELRAVDGDVIISFGGASPPELANVCSTVASLQAQYQAVITKYQLSVIDLDVEGDFGAAAIDRRNQALAALESANPNLRVHYTLGVGESGFLEEQLNILESAKQFGVRVDLVNIMAMDYGYAQPDMLGAAQSAAQAARSQLDGLGFTSTRLGITPMIGVNDTPNETFTLSDAQGLVSFARNNDVQLLAFWSVGRDNGGCPGQATASATCSGVTQSPFQFAQILRAFTNQHTTFIPIVLRPWSFL
jgi:hypothetical protein